MASTQRISRFGPFQEHGGSGRLHTASVRRFIFFHGKRHPDDLGEEEITAFLNYLAVELKVSASTQNQARNPILFLYGAAIRQHADQGNAVLLVEGQHSIVEKIGRCDGSLPIVELGKKVCW